MSSSRSSLSPNVVQSIWKILHLEMTRGYQDTAVVGGMDRFLSRFSTGAEAKQLVAHLDNHGMLSVVYHQMLPKQREMWAHEMERLLGKWQASNSKDTAKTPLARRKTTKPPTKVTLNSPLTTLHGVSSKVAGMLKRRLKIETVHHIIYLFPNRHIDFGQARSVSQLQVGQQQTIRGIVWEAREVAMGRGGRLRATEAIVGDETGNIRVVWFNQPYLARSFRTNTKLVISGRVSIFNGRKVFESPEYEVVGDSQKRNLVHTGRLVPVYPTPDGLSPRTVRRVAKLALDTAVPLVEDVLPLSVRHRVGLLSLHNAIQQAHYPDSVATNEAARRRLAFDEFFLLQLAVLKRRRALQGKVRAVPLATDRVVLEAFLRSLPFALTEAQSRALEEILADLRNGDRPMSRLLQGDVGSGKTVVALAALLMAAINGYQGAIMVPTEVLAEQHFLTISGLLGGLTRPVHNVNWVSVYLDPFPRPVSIVLLTGSLTRGEKEEARRRISDGTADIIVGTHALIQGEIVAPRLAMAVVDEQHRFGVIQRASLRQKGKVPHLLAMSATPIPRTLALTLYGDLDVVTLDQLPPGRQPVVTRKVEPEKRDAAYDFIRQQVQLGRQAFVICPLIQESEAVQARAAIEVHARLNTDVFPNLRLGLLHGRQGIHEKHGVMDAFRKGTMDILISTPVVEVGVDVPNATVMLIEGADRFGLSQLHQLRGRVGRGKYKSYCLLLAESPSQEATERLCAMEQYTDGFAIAEADLRLRGPGDAFGTRQSGLPNLRMASLSDLGLLTSAREEAGRLLDGDPDLVHHPNLRRGVEVYLGDVVEERS